MSVLPIQDCSFRLSEKDVTVITQRGHGKGGQHQNKTDSAVRMRHKETGIEVFINGRDQHRNRKVAFQIMKSRLQEKFESEKQEKISGKKKEQVGYGGRSNKIRTYNFMKDRAVDHRTNKKYSLKKVMKGNFDLLW